MSGARRRVFLDLREHRCVVHEAEPALDVGERRARVAPPGRDDGHVRSGGRLVHRDHAVPKLEQRAVERGPDGGVLLAHRVRHDRRAKAAARSLVLAASGSAASRNSTGSPRADLDDGEHAAERLGREQRLGGVRRGEPGDQRPGSSPGPGAPMRATPHGSGTSAEALEALGLDRRAPGRERGVPRLGLRVGGAPRRHGGERAAQHPEEQRPLREAPGQHEDARGMAAVRRAAHDLAREAPRLEPELVAAVEPRASRGPGWRRRAWRRWACPAAALPTPAGAPAAGPGGPQTSGVVRARRAGDVDLRDGGVSREVGARLGAAVDEAEEPARDERREARSTSAPRGALRGLIASATTRPSTKSLWSASRRGTPATSPRAEHQRDAPFGVALLVEARLLFPDALARRPGLHQHAHAEGPVQGGVLQARREHLHLDPAVRAGAHRPAAERGGVRARRCPRAPRPGGAPARA